MSSVHPVPVSLQNFIDAAPGKGGSSERPAESSTGYTPSHAGMASRRLPFGQPRNDNKNDHSIKKRAAPEIGETKNGPDNDFINKLKNYIQKPAHGRLKAFFRNNDQNPEIAISEVVQRLLRRLMRQVDAPRSPGDDISATVLRVSRMSDDSDNLRTQDARVKLPPDFFYWEPIISAVNKGDYGTALDVMTRELWLSVRLASDKLPDDSGGTAPALTSSAGRPKKTTDLVRNEFDHQFSTNIIDEKLPGNSGQNAPTSSGSADKTKKHTDSVTDEYDDDFAETIIETSKNPTQEEVESAKQDIRSSVRASRSRLVDEYTSNMIDSTMREVLSSSPTFLAILGYNNNRNLPHIRNAIYRTAFRINEQREKIPIWRNRKGSTDAGIYIGPAPNRQSAHFPTWQSSLIHEYIHYLTNAKDPYGAEAKTRHGPTEILTHRVAAEMGWSMPVFDGYMDPARVAYINNFYRESMREVEDRHADDLAAFLQRFQTISDGNEASPDFGELRNAPGTSDVARGQNNTNASPEAVVDNPDITGQSSGVRPFPFVDSSPSGAPSGYQSALAATSASWETKSRFFKYGVQIEGNPHLRRYQFPEGGRVVMEAHEPVLYINV
ncbi:M85 family metallopeptidase, partial [Paraburkholderia sp. SG-MS1]|uniref:M85 family metallopeptidase n=1 Tax=Paraburkholderia sp. SG-MS1 TaxID=2023741 RepID=UPI0014474D97